MRYSIILAFFTLFSIFNVASAVEDDVFEVEAQGHYRMEAGASTDLARAMALYTAKRKAVDQAGRYLAHKSLIVNYDLERDEIYSLAAREVRTEILDEKKDSTGKRPVYSVRIKAQVRASNFIRAEMESTRLQLKEAKESYREEMEQHVPAEIDPGKDIAKAHRLLREKKWRIAMIYLNHLAKKYPNWDTVYMAKAITHYILHEPEFMQKALNTACRLGNQIACDDASNIKRVNEHDFGLSVIE